MSIETRFRRLRRDMRGKRRDKARWWIAEDPPVTVELPFVDAGEPCSYCKGPLKVARFAALSVSYYGCEKCGFMSVGMPAGPPLYIKDIPVEWLK